jgi:SAM-dependent methyltransferase
MARFVFHRFDAVDHELANVHLQWNYEASHRTRSLAELALLLFWKISYMLDSFIPPVRWALKRSILNVYLGVWLPQSQLRLQLAKLRNDRQYQTEGAGINVGFAPPPGEAMPESALLKKWFEGRTKTRLHMQMYLKVTSLTDLKDKIVLEIGCGQGDGAAFLTALRLPARFVGIDRHPTQLALCGKRHARRNLPLSFQAGDAQELPFANGCFDAVINVESSHSYPFFERFTDEVFRVLRPGGALCFADLRKASGTKESCAALLGGQFERSGFAVMHHEDITGNAWWSLDELRNESGGRLWDEWEGLRYLFGTRAFEYHFYVLTKRLKDVGVPA